MGEERKHHQPASLCSRHRMHPLLWSTGTGRVSSAGFPASKAGHPATQPAGLSRQNTVPAYQALQWKRESTITDHTENPSVRAATGLGGGQPREEHKDEDDAANTTQIKEV